MDCDDPQNQKVVESSGTQSTMSKKLLSYVVVFWNDYVFMCLSLYLR